MKPQGSVMTEALVTREGGCGAALTRRVCRDSDRPVDEAARHDESAKAWLYSFLLIEDHPLYAEGFQTAILRLFPDAALQVVTTGEEARVLLLAHTYDLVFLDIHLPDMSGFELLNALQQLRRWQPVALLSGVVDSLVVEKAKRAGALGAMSKRMDHARLEHFCQRLLDGETLFEEESALSAQGALGPEKLTLRELDVLQKLAEGMENTQICQSLSISDSTLRTHLRALFQKMQVSNRTACVVKGIRLGWI